VQGKQLFALQRPDFITISLGISQRWLIKMVPYTYSDAKLLSAKICGSIDLKEIPGRNNLVITHPSSNGQRLYKNNYTVAYFKPKLATD